MYLQGLKKNIVPQDSILYKNLCLEGLTGLKKFYLMHGDNNVPVDVLNIDIHDDYFDFSTNPDYTGVMPFFTDDAPMPLPDRIKLWIENRVPEQGYEFIDALIARAGLEKYDPFGFFEYNKGAFISDRFHVVRFDEDER